jgi:hypothetical protein
MPAAPAKHIAWNGVALSVPAEWQPARVGARDLLLESGRGPALEIKWRPVRGRFSHRRHIARLGRGLRKTAAVEAWPLPAPWAAALSAYEAAGFRWTAAGGSAEGAVLYCPACRTATLIQFFSGRAGGAAAEILASLRDHRPDGRREFALFDIRALVPERLSLCSQRFEAGRFRLDFEARGLRVSLLRWAPAAVLLRGRSLEEFARGQPGCGQLAYRPVGDGRRSGIEGGEGPGPAAGPAGRLRAWLGRRPVRRARFWQVEAANRILGVLAEGPRQMDASEWEELCGGYAIDSGRTEACGADPGRGPELRPGQEPGGRRDPPAGR